MNEKIPQIKVIGVKEACRILSEHGMNISENKLRIGLRQGVFLFGDAIQMAQWEFDIYEHLLMKWIMERVSEDESA